MPVGDVQPSDPGRGLLHRGGVRSVRNRPEALAHPVGAGEIPERRAGGQALHEAAHIVVGPEGQRDRTGSQPSRPEEQGQVVHPLLDRPLVAEDAALLDSGDRHTGHDARLAAAAGVELVEEEGRSGKRLEQPPLHHRLEAAGRPRRDRGPARRRFGKVGDGQRDVQETVRPLHRVGVPPPRRDRIVLGGNDVRRPVGPRNQRRERNKVHGADARDTGPARAPASLLQTFITLPA